MRAHVLLLALAASLAAGGQPDAAATAIVVFTGFQHEPPAPVSDAIRIEVGEILRHAGIGFDWRSLADARSAVESKDLAVIKINGRCDIVGLLPNRVYPGALGWTYLSDGAILPFGAVDCDRIRAFIQADLLGVPAKRRQQAFGRAVGRVLAHELYHILTHSSHHRNAGVGKAEYSVRDLLDDEFVFDDAASEALRESQASQPGSANE